MRLYSDRPKAGDHLLMPRQMLLMACRAYGLQAIDTVWPDTTDMDGFREECEHIKVLGFDGKSLINPRQIDVVHDVFAPKPDEVEYALQVVAAIQSAREQGTGVVSLAGEMIDDMYANPFNSECVVNNLDCVVLGAREVDVN